MAKRSLFVRSIVILGVLVGLGMLFAATLRNVSSEPYTIHPKNLQDWVIELTPAQGSSGAILSLRPPSTLSMVLFDQVFQRAMASFSTPATPAVPLILRREFDAALSGAVSLEELMQLARAAGLENTTMQPRCMSVYRTSVGREQQLFFVLFDFPEFYEFRAKVSALLHSRNSGGTLFDPEFLTAALLVAASEGASFDQFPPRQVLEAECEAPVVSD